MLRGLACAALLSLAACGVEHPGEPEVSRAATTPKRGCMGHMACRIDCNTTATNDDEYATCISNCAKLTKDASLAMYDAATRCAFDHCLAVGDDGAKCVRDADGLSLRNEDGSLAVDARGVAAQMYQPFRPFGAKRCLLCVNNTLARLHGIACWPHPDLGCGLTDCLAKLDCDPVECASLTDACLADY